MFKVRLVAFSIAALGLGGLGGPAGITNGLGGSRPASAAPAPTSPAPRAGSGATPAPGTAAGSAAAPSGAAPTAPSGTPAAPSGSPGAGSDAGLAGAAAGSGAGSNAGEGDGSAPAKLPSPAKLQYADTAMGTNVTVWMWTDDERTAAQAAEAVFAEMKRLDREMTTWDPKSEIAQINTAAGGKPVKVSAESYAVIERAVDVSRRSKGLFDITVGAFHGLWKFDQDMDHTLPTKEEVQKRLALVNWKDIVMDPRQHTVLLRRKGMSITLGGIAKGYAVDKCVEILKKRGIANFMMQAGGDMYISGKKGSDPWTVAIRDPRGPTNSFFATAPIQDHSFSTSGDYERGFVADDGLRYHHILDTRTGQPARASRSVTVRAKDAFTADAWSKVLFIMGPEKALELIKREKLTDFEVVWVDDKNQVVMTDGLKNVVKVIKEPTPGP